MAALIMIFGMLATLGGMALGAHIDSALVVLVAAIAGPILTANAVYDFDNNDKR